MNFNNIKKSKKELIKLSLMALTVFFVGFSTYNINLKIKMNFLLDKADNAYIAENYSTAIENYKVYLSYDNSDLIKNKLEKTIELEESKTIYIKTIELMNDQKYLEAIDTFEKTDYNEEAISTLNTVLQVDKNSAEVANLLQTYQEKYDILKKANALKKKVFSERYDFLNNKSSNGYKVEVCVPYQEVYVYKNNELLRTMVCSTGIDSKPTPLGYFSTGGKGKYFFSKKYAQGAFYWINFLNNKYLFHTLPVDYNKNIIKSEALKLGEKASHGCIRLSFDDAKWLYNTIPSYNTLVYVH